MSDGDEQPRSAGRVQAFLRRLAANKGTHDAEQLQKEVATSGATPIKSCSPGSRTRVVGTIRSITIQPITGTPSLDADLWDGTGSLKLVWLGRREIAGIDPGRSLLVEGRITEENGRPVMYNPWYELRAEASGAGG